MGNLIYEGKSTIVDMEKQLCTSCEVRHQWSLPCRHVIRVIHVLISLPTVSIMEFVHPVYKIQTNVQCFGQQSIVIPAT
jgi:hypothetical protein